MKKNYLFFLFSIILSTNSLRAQSAPSAHTLTEKKIILWCDDVTKLEHSEIHLMENILFCSKDLAEKDLRARKFGRLTQKIVQIFADQTLNPTEKKTVSSALLSKTTGIMIVVSKNYKNAYSTWEHCIKFLDSKKQTKLFDTLIENFRIISQEETIKALIKINNDIDIVTVTVGQKVSTNCKTIYSELQKLVELSTTSPQNKNIIFKIDALEKTSNVIAKKSNENKETMQSLLELSEKTEQITLSIIDLFYKKLSEKMISLNLPKNLTTIMFDEIGFIPENERGKQLPRF
ncbi:hypothetical protein KAH94_00715 [bacterium]|nr:hypothetical protein [bacterium]